MTTTVEFDPTANNWLATNAANRAKRILDAAQRGIQPIGAVLSSPIVPTIGANGANSTIITNATTNGANARYPILATDTASPHFDVFGGVLDNNVVRTGLRRTTDPARRNCHGGGIRFATYAQTFDISVDSFSAGRIAVYVTDLLTGERRRATADDYTPTANTIAYVRFDFGSRGLRLIEIYQDYLNRFLAINVPTTDSIWKYQMPAQPKIAVNWDSYSNNIMSAASGDATQNNVLSLSVIDYMAARLGSQNITSFGVAATGLVANGSGTDTTYIQRIQNGDMNAARVGDFDLIYSPFSLNDTAYAEATVTAAAVTYFQALRAAQPNAIIVSAGPQTSNTSTPTQARFDAYRAAFLSVADANMIWLDNSPSGENWMFGNASGGINQAIIGTDNTHLNKAGAAYLGERIGASIINALRGKYGL
jgi:lysophospholipase L1-like esterase